MSHYEGWQEYWDKFLLTRHGKEKVANEEDLYLQVARTVHKKPIGKHIFDGIIDNIKEGLSLNKEDVLVDLCCGNGLFTYELKDSVKQIIGVDFAQPIIDAANEFRSAENISYHLGSIVTFLKSFKEKFPHIVPTKYLMNDSLAYFSPDDLESMLSSISDISGKFIFLNRGIPSEDLKWNYYNTEERRAFYNDLVAQGDLTNNGMGAWWPPEEIIKICGRLRLNVVITNEQLPVSDYRMDAVISN